MQFRPLFWLFFIIALAGILVSSPVYGNDVVEERLRNENIRSTILSAYDALLEDGLDRTEAKARLDFHSKQVLAFGSDALPFLLPEIESPSERFFVATTLVGAIGDAAAIPTVEAAIEANDALGGSLGKDRKAWLAITLAQLGRPDAAILLEQGDTPAGATQMFVGQNAIQLAAMISSPESVDLLIEYFERLTREAKEVSEAEQEQFLARRHLLLEAARFATRSFKHDGLLALARKIHSDPDWQVRQHALGALLEHGSKEDLDIARLYIEDPKLLVRGIALQMIAELPGKRGLELVTLMQKESNAGNRGMLQMALVDHLGAKATIPLETELENDDPIHRINALRAALMLQEGGNELLLKGLKDRDLRVGLNAMRYLRGRKDMVAAETLLPHLLDPKWPFAQQAIATVVELAPKEAGPRIAGRILGSEIKSSLDHSEKIQRIQFLLDALVQSRFTTATQDIKSAAEAMGNDDLIRRMQPYFDALDLLDNNKDDVPAWIALLNSEIPIQRKLATERILELADPKGIQILADTFPDRSAEDKIHLLEQLADYPYEPLFSRVEEVLSSPEYDSIRQFDIRNMAAWAAYNYGTEASVKALADNVKRRQGIDYIPFIYWIDLAPKEAHLYIEPTRVHRLLDFKHDRAYEQKILDRLERRIRRGFKPNGTSFHPRELVFKM